MDIKTPYMWTYHYNLEGQDSSESYINRAELLNLNEKT